MNKLKVVPYEKRHIAQLKARPVLVREEDSLYPFFDYTPNSGRFYSFLLEDTVVCCAGLVPVREGVAELLMFTSDAVRFVGAEFTKMCGDLLNILVDQMALHRVEGYVHSDFRVGRIWAKKMGFHLEGLLKKFGSDQSDYYLFARTY